MPKLSISSVVIVALAGCSANPTNASNGSVERCWIRSNDAVLEGYQAKIIVTRLGYMRVVDSSCGDESLSLLIKNHNVRNKLKNFRNENLDKHESSISGKFIVSGRISRDAAGRKVFEIWELE